MNNTPEKQPVIRAKLQTVIKKHKNAYNMYAYTVDPDGVVLVCLMDDGWELVRPI